jgi:TRAP-type C4-dicarboxylate transport system substrate-binding protein
MKTELSSRRGVLRASLAAAAAPWLGQAQAESAWTFATGYRAETFHGQVISQLLRDWAGLPRMPAITLQANNSLYKLADIEPALREGRLEFGETIMASMVARLPVAGADSVPFVVRSYADARRLWLCQRPVIERALREAGVVVLYAVPWPPQGLYTRHPLANIAELRGSRMRSYNRTTARIAELLGATPVDVPMAEVGRALKEGRIDSMITSAVTGVENRAWQYLTHFHEVNAWFPKNIVLAGARSFERLDGRTRQGVREAANAAEGRGWASSEAAATESVAELKRQGMRVEPVAPAVLADLRRLGERFSLEWIREVGPLANEIFIPYYTQA